uniref:Polyketide synthase n=1 Tax=Pestalotiopsis microspora TaxID=85828 RepID=A0A1P8NTI6_PESMI|nr:polyketide synthase [Pestalotiopsis microspora]
MAAEAISLKVTNPHLWDEMPNQVESKYDYPRLDSGSFDSELDGIDGEDPVVVCGFSVKLPQDATNPDTFWKLMMDRRCAMTEFPDDRMNMTGFFQREPGQSTIPVRGGHFFKEDVSAFDAGFFSISATEAASMDPMQRMLLEVSYAALENAGMTIHDVSGSRTGVYTGSFGIQDHTLQLARDPECSPTHAAVGSGLSMLANRISWFYNLHGPSIGVDSACSSATMAIDIASQALITGSCDMALVTGCNMAMSPEFYTWLSNMDFLSPDGRCHSFDHRANGYARGEGIGVVVLSRLSRALANGYTIRAIIRSTGSNEDGRTPSITYPSGTAQERLIRETYSKAGLSTKHTRFFEAHGTGTAVGDPIEAGAIGSVFREHRSVEEPLYVGAVKSNIGHLEGAAGIAALVKTIMVLERGIIPPNTNFEKLNPKIDADFLRLKFPSESHNWPSSGLRRASINSFGYGGANSHIVVDDAGNYLRLRGLEGRHCTDLSPNQRSVLKSDKLHNSTLLDDQATKLVVLSASDESGIARISQGYHEWKSSSHQSPNFLDDLVYTLDSHRSHLQWRSFALLQSSSELGQLSTHLSVPNRARLSPPRLAFVFSGQGAQWATMGKDLMRYPSFLADLEQASSFLRGVGCEWEVIGELLKPASTSNIHNVEFSQTLCTVLQVALVNLLRRFNVQPSAVVGHSSGEIAAAYCAGYITQQSAWKLAYFRGLCSAKMERHSGSKGAMISVALSEQEAGALISSFNKQSHSFGLAIACINSPQNVTISGEELLIDELKILLDERQVFARKLRVPVAYHSPQVHIVSETYESMIGSLPEVTGSGHVPMISSVIGGPIDPQRVNQAKYWVDNMISTVRFAQAVAYICEQPASSLAADEVNGNPTHGTVVDHLIEVGPHAVLQGPLREILKTIPRGKDLGYSSVLRRGSSAVDSMLKCMGELHCMGQGVNLRAVNDSQHDSRKKSTCILLVDLPQYPFDHSRTYCSESRVSRDYRLRKYAPIKLLGIRSQECDPSCSRWRTFIRTSEIPWAEDHVIEGRVLYPASGMLVMAIEASRQLLESPEQSIDGYTLRDVKFEAPMDLSESNGILEVQTSLRRVTEQTNMPSFYFNIHSYSSSNWIMNCSGWIDVGLSRKTSDTWVDKVSARRQNDIVVGLTSLSNGCQSLVESSKMFEVLTDSGLDYGSRFRELQQDHMFFNDEKQQAAAEVKLFEDIEDQHKYIVHPVTLDAILRLSYTSFTSGGSRKMPTSIPTGIGFMWLSHRKPAPNDVRTLTACSQITDITRRGYSCNGGVLTAGCQSATELVLHFHALEMTNITNSPAANCTSPVVNPRQFCMDIDCKISLDKTHPSKLQGLLDNLHPAHDQLVIQNNELSLLSELTLLLLEKSFDPSILDGTHEFWKRRYWQWASHHLGVIHRKRSWGDAEISTLFTDLCQRLMTRDHAGRLYATVASNLTSFLQGSSDPLEQLLHTGLLKNCYEEWSRYRCSLQAATYMDLFAHQNPGITILEVGGGTAATTRNFLSTLGNGNSLRCKRYDFTDISSAFFTHAREEFCQYSSQMSFKTLDLEKDLTSQGFEEGSYDVVVADNVLHVPESLATTLKTIRKALKPNGKLIMQEIMKPDGWTAGFVFGLFPGWWLGGISDGRQLSPNIGAPEWDTLLKSHGFSGVDFLFRDTDNEEAHHMGWVISTALPEVPSPQPSLVTSQLPIIVIQDRTNSLQYSFAKCVERQSPCFSHSRPTILSLPEAADMIGGNVFDGLVVFLDCGPQSLLDSIDSQSSWNNLKRLVISCRHLLWVTAGGGNGHEANPSYGMLDGFSRTLRSENYLLHLVTLALDLGETMTQCFTDNQAGHLSAVVSEMVSREQDDRYEQEYVEMNGLLHTRRLAEASRLKEQVELRSMPYQMIKARSDGQICFAATTVGSQDSLQFAQTSSERGEKGENHDTVEIQVRAVSLQSRDKVHLLEAETKPDLGSYCSGTITHVGSNVSLYKIGDHVISSQHGSFRSHIRAQAQSIARLPSDWTFTDACQTIPPTVVAYHALVEAGRVKASDLVLIHAGANPIGKAALQLLLRSHMGCKGLYISVENEDEAATIMEDVCFPLENIVPRSWFGSDMQLALSEFANKFNIIFDLSQEKSAVSVLVNFLRPNGHIIQLCHDPKSRLNPLFGSVKASNISHSFIDINQAPSWEALKYATTSPKICSSSWTTILKANSTDEISNRLRTLDDQASLVVNLDDQEINLKKSRTPTFTARYDATYLISGGLGGLGREIARWLVSCGARYLILLSRSGPQTSEARELVDDLTDKDVMVQAMSCDVSNAEALASVLDQCASKGFPPIKGCIQAAMVMKERVFTDLTLEDWKNATSPKVKGSWNLHSQLPQDLDFFVLVSSSMGVLGTGALAGYNAGNTYQDALARLRVARGQHAISVNLGAIYDGGYLKEQTHQLLGPKKPERYVLMSTLEVMALMDWCCTGATTTIRGDIPNVQPFKSQAVVGISPPAHWKHIEDVPAVLEMPLWGHMHHLPALPANAEEEEAAVHSDNRNASASLEERLASAETLADCTNLTTEMLIHRVSTILGTPIERLDVQSAIHSYGIDSLSAIELRNWVLKAFKVDLPVFKIMSGATFEVVGIEIAQALHRRDRPEASN